MHSCVLRYSAMPLGSLAGFLMFLFPGFVLIATARQTRKAVSWISPSIIKPSQVVIVIMVLMIICSLIRFVTTTKHTYCSNMYSGRIKATARKQTEIIMSSVSNFFYSKSPMLCKTRFFLRIRYDVCLPLPPNKRTFIFKLQPI